MGFSIAGSGGIVFVALIVTFSILSGAFYSSLESFEVNLNEDTERRLSKHQTDIEIKSIRYSRSENTTIMEVKNTGSTTLNATHSNIILDGNVIASHNISYNIIERKGYHWSPNELLEIRIEDVDLDFRDDIVDRVESKVRHGLEFPGAISSNSDYTYLVEEGDVDQKGSILIYDYKDNLVNQITSDTLLERANDVSATFESLYAIDEQSRVIEFDIEGEEGEVLISEDDEELDSPRAISVTEENPENYIYLLDNETEVHRYHLNGTYKDTIITDLEEAIDLYVTDHVYLVNRTGNTIDRYDLTGNEETILIDNLETPTNLTVSDQYFEDPLIYVVDENSHIRVFDDEGVHITNITEELGNNLWGIDVHGRISISNGFNGWYRLYLGSEIKIVLQNGITEYEMI